MRGSRPLIPEEARFIIPLPSSPPEALTLGGCTLAALDEVSVSLPDSFSIRE
jgi:hypothetical protein